MGMINSIWYGKEEPQRRDMLWARPTRSGFSFYVFDGRWLPQKAMNDLHTFSPYDDEVIPLEQMEVKKQYADIYIGVGNSIESMLTADNFYSEPKEGDSIPIKVTQEGYLYVISESKDLPKILMNNFLIPTTESVAIVDGTSYHVSTSTNTYSENITVEIK